MSNGSDQHARHDADASTSNWFSRSIPLHLLVLCTASFALYIEALRNGFVADDRSEVLQDPLIRSFRDVPKLFAHSVWYFSGATGDRYYRPLKLFAYSVEYHLFHFDPTFWHLVNLVLNAGVVVALYFLVRDLARGPAAHGRTMAEGAARQLAFWTALVFAFHPIHTEDVAWIAAGNDLWCGLALILTLWFYHRARSGIRPGLSFSLSALLFFAALYFKETALTFPAVILAYDFLYRGEPFRELARNWRRYVAYFAALGVYLAMRWHALGGFAPNNPHNVLTAVQFVLTVPVIATNYIWKALVPIHLDAWYTFHPVSTFGWQAAGAIALCVFLVFAVFWLRRQPLLSLSLAWFGLTLIPVLDIPKLGNNVFAERYLYIPSVGFCVILAWAWQRLLDWSPRPVLSRLAYATIAALLAFYSFVAVRRIPVWRSNYALWTETARQDPGDPVVQNAAGAMLLKRHEYKPAFLLLHRAVALAPDQGYPHNTLGGAYFDLHRYDLALREYRRAVALDPGVSAYWRNLGVVYANENQWPESTAAFGRAVSLSRTAAPPAPTGRYYAGLSLLYVQYGTSLEDDALPAKAASAFRSALQTDPQRVGAYIGLAKVLTAQHRLDEAAAVLQSGLRANPHSVQNYLALGRIYMQQGRKVEAEKEFQQAVAISSASSPQPAYFSQFQLTGPKKARRLP